MLVSDVLEATSKASGLSVEELRSRKRRHTLARHAAMLVARTRTRKSYKQIATAMGGRDHTTIMYGVRMAKQLRETDQQFAELVSNIEHRLEETEHV